MTALLALFTSNWMKYAAYGVALLFVGGVCFVWGDAHATTAAIKAANEAANEQIAANDKAYNAQITDLDTRWKQQAAAAQSLSSELDAAKTKLQAVTLSAQNQVAHVIPKNPSCDFPAPAIDLLRQQPARS